MDCGRRKAMSLAQHPWFLRVMVFTIALFYGAVVFITLCWSWVRNPKKFSRWPKERLVPPACLTDPERGTHCFAQLKDIKLHYVEKGDKSKPLMLFVHGYPEFWYSWRHQMDEFSKDFWTVAVDMRGYGDSDKPKGVTNYTTKVLVEDLRGLVEFLGREKFTLVAHDWGGIIAWLFVHKHSEMLDHFIIMGSAEPLVFAKFIMREKRQFFKSWYMFFYQLPWLPEFAARWNDLDIFRRVLQGKNKQKSTITDEDVEAYKYTFGKPGDLTGPINYYRANIFKPPKVLTPKRSTEKETDILLPVPGLCMAGEKDLYIDAELLELTKKKYTNLLTEVVEGADHFLQQDKPKAVNKIMRDFLQET